MDGEVLHLPPFEGSRWSTGHTFDSTSINFIQDSWISGPEENVDLVLHACGIPITEGNRDEYFPRQKSEEGRRCPTLAIMELVARLRAAEPPPKYQVGV